MNNVLVRENEQIKNSTLNHIASNNDSDSLSLMLLILFFIYIVALILNIKKHEIEEKDHRENHSRNHIDRYSMDIQWSNEDNAFLVTVPELPGCVTHGNTYEEATRQGRDAIESWIEASREWGDPIPPPQILTPA
ncbi:MAG: type II toxin-antitoxin system HicB family antitoxin [Ktedonobacteraceae bacterium]